MYPKIPLPLSVVLRADPSHLNLPHDCDSSQQKIGKVFVGLVELAQSLIMAGVVCREQS